MAQPFNVNPQRHRYGLGSKVALTAACVIEFLGIGLVADQVIKETNAITQALQIDDAASETAEVALEVGGNRYSTLYESCTSEELRCIEVGGYILTKEPNESENDFQGRVKSLSDVYASELHERRESINATNEFDPSAGLVGLALMGTGAVIAAIAYPNKEVIED